MKLMSINEYNSVSSEIRLEECFRGQRICIDDSWWRQHYSILNTGGFKAIAGKRLNSRECDPGQWKGDGH